MQNRRILDAIFRALGVRVTPRIEANSIDTLYAHVRLSGTASIMPHAMPAIFGVPQGLRCLSLTPDIKHEIGLVVADIEPLPPIARGLWQAMAEKRLDREIEGG